MICFYTHVYYKTNYRENPVLVLYNQEEYQEHKELQIQK